MALVTVTITGQAITARYGTLNTGDVLRTDAEFARHLVEDCSAAVYSKIKVAPTAEVAMDVIDVVKSKLKKSKSP